MNKKQFLSILETRLAPLHPEERRELIGDVEAHFDFGLQNGRSEEEIARELGDPFEVAREALGDRFTDMPVYLPSNPSIIGRIFILIGLFFTGLIAVPLLAAFWSCGIGFAAASAGGIASPVLLLIDYLLNGNFSPAKLFMSISLVGVGILLAYLSRWIFIGLWVMTKGYAGWNIRMMKGRSAR